jgi:hypothetical protein
MGLEALRDFGVRWAFSSIAMGVAAPVGGVVEAVFLLERLMGVTEPSVHMWRGLRAAGERRDALWASGA